MRAKQVQDTADVSVYEGPVPVHQRLSLLCYDFLESTWDFELNELFNFQGNINELEKSMQDHKAEKMNRLIKELFKKYQLEIVTPNIDYIVNKFKTSFELYKTQEGPQKESEKSKAKELLKFKHSMFDKHQEVNKITQNKKKTSLGLERRGGIRFLTEDLESQSDLGNVQSTTKIS